MDLILLGLVLLVGVVCLVLLLLQRRQVTPQTDYTSRFELLERAQERIEKLVREEMAAARREAGEAQRLQREEASRSMEHFVRTTTDMLTKLSDAQKGRLEEFGNRLTANSETGIKKLEEMRLTLDGRLKESNESVGAKLDQARTEQAASSKVAREEQVATLKAMQTEISTKLEQVRQDSSNSAKLGREEQNNSLTKMNTLLFTRLSEVFKEQNDRLDSFGRRVGEMIEANDKKGEALKQAVEQKLKEMREENSLKLEEMRKTVDEKLQGTLEKRLGESFKQVSERLEQVHKGLGEMQTLASGVGDLKKVMTNVKTRGTWGEVALHALLEQILTPEQYEANVKPDPQRDETVEFAIRLPGRDESRGVIYLPIDAKFPVEDYQRLVDAQEAADKDAVDLAIRQLDQAIKNCARDICDKYISPPHTTDFGIMFLPSEGLYAEVIRRTGVVEYCQRDCRVVIAGPTTLAAILNSLQMGFRTLAIQKRSSEVWEVLGAVKTEFGKFGGVLEKVKKKLQEASNSVDAAEVRTRAMNRKLRTVESLSPVDASSVLQLTEGTSMEDALLTDVDE